MKTLAILVSLTAILSIGVRAEEAYVPSTVEAREAAQPPKIDGDFDDACWQGCPKVTGFIDSSHNRPAAFETEVMVCRDAAYLYLVFICRDPDPSLIHAEQTQRDCDFTNDDYVGILIDPLNEHQTHYHFEVNPKGIQRSTSPSGAASNVTWRGDWYAAAKVTDTGWVAEMAIPYSCLRYPKGATTFGFSFRRYIPRLDERSVWPDLGPVSDQTRFAELVNLDPPAQRARPVLMPFTVSSVQPGRSFTDIGFDFKEELPNNMIAMAAYNPDFSDVQDAVASLSYSYVERFLPEQRPFFQEGAGYFPGSRMFYSRRIGDIDFGLKSCGRVGSQTFAFMDAMSSGRDNHFAGTYANDFSEDSGVALYFAGSTVRDAFKTDPSEPDSSMSVSPGGWMRWRSASGITSVSLRSFKSLNSEGAGNGSSYEFDLSRSASARNLSYSLSYDSIDRDYYVRDAYIPLTGVRGGSGKLSYYDKPANGKITYWDCYITGSSRSNQGGGLHDKGMAIGASVELKSEWSFAAYKDHGMWEGQRDATAMVQVGWLTRHLYGGGSLGYNFGTKADQDYTYAWADQSFRITPRLSVACGIEWTRLGSDDSRQYTVLGNYELSPERSVGLWAVGRGGDLNMCLTYRQKARSGSDIYLIYGYPNTQTTEQRIALKVVHPMTW